MAGSRPTLPAAVCQRRTYTASNLILEGVRQIRAPSHAQVENADVSLVTGGEFVPTSGTLLRR